MLKRTFVMLLAAVCLAGCGEGDAPSTEESIAQTAQENIEEVKTESTVAMTAVEEEAVDAIEDVVQEKTQTMQEIKAESVSSMQDIESHATQAITDLKEQAADARQQLEASAADAGASIDTTNKPYQLVDGAISANAMEGWKTYNGGGCGACHGKGGVGAVAPNLGVSVTQKLSKEEFIDVVTNGRSGTMMRPHKTNTRVMENLDNLYAYLVARGDGVLGPGNLIKSPLGKE